MRPASAILALSLLILHGANDRDASGHPPENVAVRVQAQDAAEARRSLEALIRTADEGVLIEEAKRSEGARQALAEIRAHKRFGDAYPLIKLVTLELNDRPTPEFLQESSKALGVRFKKEESNDPGIIPNPLNEKATVEIRDAYLFEALDQVARAVGADWWREGDSIVLSTGARPAPLYQLYYRHFKIIVESFEEERHRDFLGGETASASLRFHISSDSLCRFVGYKGTRFLEVTDPAGRSLLQDNPRESVRYDTFQILSEQVGVKIPSADSKKLARVRGVFTVLFPERPTSGEILLYGEKRDLTLPNLIFTVEKVSEGAREVRVSGKVGDLNKPHVPPEVKDFRLKAKDGRLLAARGSRSRQRELTVLELSFTVPAGFEPASLGVEYYEAVGEHEIPFDFKDVPIR